MKFFDTEVKLSEPLIQRVKEACDHNKNPDILFFKVLGPCLQKIYETCFDLSEIPLILIHGNPHLDNYSRTFTGAGLGDFNRSRIGPFTWDLIRGIGSIEFWGENRSTLESSWVDDFKTGYILGLSDMHAYWSCPDFLKLVKPKKWSLTPKKYIRSGEKWSKKLKNFKSDDDSFMTDLFEAMLEQNPMRSELSSYQISKMAKVPGSMGKVHFIYLLKDKENPYKAPLIYDIKETYTEADSTYFSNPFESQGKRIIIASNHYAPALEVRMSATTLDDVDYWGREVPTLSIKPPKSLVQPQQEQLAREVGIQLGVSHRKASKDDGVEILDFWQSKSTQIIETSFAFNQQIRSNLQELIL